MASSAAMRTNELTSLAERINYLQALRVMFAVTTLLTGLLATRTVDADMGPLFLVTAAYVFISGGSESLRRIVKGRSIAILFGTLLVDGVYIAWVAHATGGTESPLRFLAFVHIIAVTLLASSRTGLKIAVWHSLLFFVVFYAEAAGLLETSSGSLNADDPRFNEVSAFNVIALLLVAGATAVFSQLNERELRRRRGDLQDLADLASALEDETEVEGVAQKVLDAIGESFGFKRGAVLGMSPTGMALWAYRGPGEVQRFQDGTDAIFNKVLDDKQTQLIAKLDETQNPRLTGLMTFARNLVFLPLVADNEKIGVLVLENPSTSGSFIHKRVLETVERFAAHGALSLRNAQLMKQVQRMADTDGLTGIPNRRSFEMALEKELSRSARSGEPVTLMMVDVDHFKKFNDSYGHQAGDDVLKGVGAALVDASRDFDTPARYGGEEFAVILPACSSDQSLQVAERLRERICEVKAVAPVTASAGVATYPTHAADAAALIKAADEALYESKRAGRNRLSRASEGAPNKAAKTSSKSTKQPTG